jgi:hypothetical protein
LQTVGLSLQRGPDGQEIASFRGGLWYTAQGEFGLVRFDSPVLITFRGDGPAASFGPLEKVMIVGGMLRYGEGANAFLARLDDQAGAWELLSDQKRYATVVFAAARRRAGRASP